MRIVSLVIDIPSEDEETTCSKHALVIYKIRANL